MSKITGSEAIVRSLIAEDVDIIYGYPGGAIMPVYDELYKFQNEILHVLTRHEQGAIHAAQGLARVTDKVGVAIATSGPGATNLVTGIADAQIDSTPIVCITGQVPRHLLGSDAFQETDIISISMPVTKWNCQVTEAEEIPEVIAKAFYIAKSGRPGPVLIDITKNAQFDTFNFSYKKCTKIRSYVPSVKPNFSEIEKAAKLINNAKKPYVVWGQGVVLGKAEKQFIDFLNQTGIPAASTILGLSALPTNHPLNMGMVGMHGNYAPNILTNECDVLIAIGMRFDDRVTGQLDSYAKQAKVIHFEIDLAEINKNVMSEVFVLGCVKETLLKLNPLLKNKSYPNWINKFKELQKIEFEKIIKKDITPTEETLTMGEVIEKINILADGNAIFVSDVGQHQMITCRYAKFNNTKSNVTSGGLGTMGFALPAAMGAKMGQPNKEVVAVIGDGGFQMTLQELATIHQMNIPVKIVILNNTFLGMVRQWQELFFENRYASTELVNPDFVAIAKGFFIDAEKVSKRNELDKALKKMMTSKSAYLVEVMVEKENNVFPMIPSGSSVSNIKLS